MLVLLAIVGVAIGFSTDRRPLSRVTRYNAGAVLLSILALSVISFAGALAASHRGLPGSISHGFNSLTNTHAAVPANTPGRLTAIGSVRARYWNEALEVFQAYPVLGAGARSYGTARLRHRTEDLEANDAHGFVVQTLSDLGLVGLAIALALFVTWMAAAGRCTHPFNRRWTSWRWQPTPMPYTPERIGMLSMLCLVVVFGVHSTVDWTWFVPGDACVALLCAGWLAGRGPLLTTGGELAADGGLSAADELFSAAALAAPAGSEGARLPSEAQRLYGAEDGESSHPPPLHEVGPLRLGIAAAVVVAALLAAWAQWQPQRSADASQEALALSARDPAAARAAAQNAVDYDPVSAEALFTLSTIQQHAGESALARATLVRAVHLQPSNPQTWKALGEYDLRNGNPTAALNELRATVYLNPEAVAPLSVIQYDPELLAIQNAYIQALRETTTSSASVRHVTVVRSPRRVKAIVRSPAGVKSVTAVRSPAALAARRAVLRRAALRRRESRNPRVAR